MSQFQGHVVSGEGISPDSSKTSQMREWPVPTSVKETQQFLGLASYYRQFIKNFASIASPLHKLTEKSKTNFQWTSQCQEAFDCLKTHLISPPVLAMPDWSQSFLLDTDASDTGIGGALSKVQDGKERVIADASRSLTKAELNYCITRRELLAVITFLQHFRPSLLGAPFTVRTDHHALAWIQKFKELEGQIARWVQKLQEYQFNIIHRPRLHHNNADALSRIPCRQCGMVPADEIAVIADITVSDLASTMAYTTEELHAAQMEDPCSGLVLTAKEANHHPDTITNEASECQRLWQLWNQLTVRNGLLHRLFNDQSDHRCWLQLILPSKFHSEILASLVAGSHLGQEKNI